jgi:hypothetical protein
VSLRCCGSDAGCTYTQILFYCHYPDKLLSTGRGFFKRLYRAPLDAVEEWTTGRADRVLVNSQFTRGVFRAAFKRLAAVAVDVLYPGINLAQYDAATAAPRSADAAAAAAAAATAVSELTRGWRFVVLSINRCVAAALCEHAQPTRAGQV